jgi:hypothetical protein
MGLHPSLLETVPDPDAETHRQGSCQPETG